MHAVAIVTCLQVLILDELEVAGGCLCSDVSRLLRRPSI